MMQILKALADIGTSSTSSSPPRESIMDDEEVLQSITNG